MDTKATGEQSVNSRAVQREDRNTWIFTVYAICGIVFFGVLAYFASVFFTN